jgi:hypothetical protein
MVIFIDESGTHKQMDHATIALVYVEVTNLNVFERSVEEIETELKIKYFHWTDENWDIRKRFINKLAKLKFRVKVAILKNPVVVGKSLEASLRHLVVEPNIKKIMIDGYKPRWYDQKLKKILRDKGITVKKLKTIRNEHSCPGLRVADCLAGLIRYFYNHPHSEAKTLYDRLKAEAKIVFELKSFS